MDPTLINFYFNNFTSGKKKKVRSSHLGRYSPMNKACIVMEKVQGLRYLEQTMLHFQQAHFLESKNLFEQLGYNRINSEQST